MPAVMESPNAMIDVPVDPRFLTWRSDEGHSAQARIASSTAPPAANFQRFDFAGFRVCGCGRRTGCEGIRLLMLNSATLSQDRVDTIRGRDPALALLLRAYGRSSAAALLCRDERFPQAAAGGAV